MRTREARTMRRMWMVAGAVGATASLIVGGAALAANTPGGSPTPANKAIAAGSDMAEFGLGQNVTLLTATLRTSKPTDLMLQTTLECSILTKLSTGPSATPGATDSQSTSATIRGWIEVDDDPA